jgi:RHS repeat-associated protein
MPGRTLAQGPQANEDYTGHELDAETGMHYAGARYYMSALGRWGTTDPILDEQGPGALLQQDPRLLTMSAYNYTFNDPANLLDPDGRCPTCKTAAVGAAIGAVAGATVETYSQIASGEDISLSDVGRAAAEGGYDGAIAGSGQLLWRAGAGAVKEAGLAYAEGEDLGSVVAAGAQGAVEAAGPLGRLGPGKNMPQSMQDVAREAWSTVGNIAITTPGGETVNLLHDATRIATGGDEEDLRSPVFKNDDGGTEGGTQAPDHVTRDDRLDSGSTVSSELRDDNNR